MMEHPAYTIECAKCSPLLYEIPEHPETLYVRGQLPEPGHKVLSVVGSRNYTNYGKQVVEHLLSGLKGYPVTIVSGLALGIDTMAHTAALNAGLHTMAVPGSGISDAALYPRRNLSLAKCILEHGGCLVGEFEPDFKATPWSFPKRNRIMAGLAHAVLLIEAGERSGTLITARLTVEYNRELLVVPGNIFSENSKGVHQFLKLGATPVTAPEDILLALGIEEKRQPTSPGTLSEDEMAVLEILREPRDHDAMIRMLPYPREATLVLLMQMELSGTIREQNGVYYRVRP